jgi:hypothetical protein
VPLDNLLPDGRLPDEDEEDEEAAEYVDAADDAQEDLESVSRNKNLRKENLKTVKCKFCRHSILLLFGAVKAKNCFHCC